jgi:hypothetical protein
MLMLLLVTATTLNETAKPRTPRINGISADAEALGVTREHLFLVLRGIRKSDPLRARYQALKQAQQKKRMKTTRKPNPPATISMPIELAALQNLQPSFFKTLTTLGLDVVIVRFKAEKDSIVWRHDTIATDIGNEMAVLEAGHFDSSFFPLGAQWHFYQVDRAKLGAAIHRIKETLAERGLLEISGIYHAESAEILREWFPGSAAEIDTMKNA